LRLDSWLHGLLNLASTDRTIAKKLQLHFGAGADLEKFQKSLTQFFDVDFPQKKFTFF